MQIKIQEIKRFLKETGTVYSYNGSEKVVIEGFSSLNNIRDNSITWLKKVSPESLQLLVKKKNVVVVCKENGLCDNYRNLNYIFCEYPKNVFFDILSFYFGNDEEQGIMDTAVIKSKNVGENCFIGHHSFIGADVTLEDNVYVGHNVTIQNRVYIKENTIIGSGCVIGGDGFGYYKDDRGISKKVPHFGGVIIGKNVEIGSNTCIDRGTLDDTIIGDYVKIDNLCHIAHNVQIGEKSKVIALSVLAGSCKLGEAVYVAPGTLVKNQVKVGAGSVIGMGGMVLKDVEKGKVMVGAPAKVLRNVTEEDFNL